MSEIVKIDTRDGKVYASSPYHPAFVSRARKLGGKWKAAFKAWEFDARDEDRVRAACMEVYGTDGTGVATVTLRVECVKEWSGYQSGLFLAGREVVHATGKLSGAKLGSGVVLLSGRIASGGSHKNWYTIAMEGAVLEIRDLPLPAAEKALAADYEGLRLSLVPPTDAEKVVRLREERNRIEHRLQEINLELETLAEPECRVSDEMVGEMVGATR